MANAKLDPPPLQHPIADPQSAQTAFLTPQPWALWFQRVSGQGGGTGAPAYGVIAVPDQDDVPATTATDTLTINPGANIAIETNPLGKAFTVAVDPAGDTWQVQFRGNTGRLDASPYFTFNELLTGAGLGSASVAGGSSSDLFASAYTSTLDVETAVTDPDAPFSTQIVGTTFTPSASSASFNFGVFSKFRVTGGEDSATNRSIYGEGDHSGTGTADFIGGVDGHAYLLSSGNANYAVGVNAAAGSYGSGDITACVGIQSHVDSSGSGTWTEAFNLICGGVIGSASDTIGTLYGVYVNDLTEGSANYAWYSGLGAIRMGEIAAPAAQTYAVVVDDDGVLSSQAVAPGGGITQLTGDVTAGPGSGSVAATIAANAVTDAKFRQSSALSVVGRSANSTGNVADISASAASGAVLRESGSAIGFGTIATAGIAANAVTFAKFQQIATQRVVGRNTSGTGDTEEVTITQLLDWTA